MDQVTVNVTIVKCAGCGSFDDGETCCVNLQGSWMCYQFRGQCVAMKEIRAVHLGWQAFKKEIVIVSRFYDY